MEKRSECGKSRIKQQKLKNPVRRKVGGVDLAVRLKRGRAAQQAHPFEVFVAIGQGVLRGPKLRLVGLQQHGRGGGALHVAAHLDELPALAVAHGGVGHALKLVDGLHHLAEELHGPFALLQHRRKAPIVAHLGPGDLQVQAVEPLPHLGGDLLAHVPRIFTGRDDACQHARLRVRGRRSACAPGQWHRPPT